ncbi:rRNA maturation RNase YbeY [bacterium]|nr:rRNA maturation RNase YbeY [bacterium]
MTELIARLARAQGRARQPLAVLFTGDAEMKTYHRRYLGKSKCTDVLSFPAGEPDFPCETQRLGDLIISLPAVRRQAARLGHARARELAYLLLHGFLHLCGYDHESDELAWADAELRLGRLVNHLLPPGWQHRALGMLGEP